MFVVIFHMLYLFGKYVYDNCRNTKVNTLLNGDTEEETADCHVLADVNKVEASNDISLLSVESPSLKFSPPAYIQRYLAVASVLNESRYENKLRKIVDFGCSGLNFLPYVKHLVGAEEILFVDIDREILEQNKFKAAPLITDHLQQRQMLLKIEICEGSVIHNDKKLENTDAVVCIELIEHLCTPVLLDVPANIFGYIRPKVVIITTPNAEFNVLFPNIDGFRHPDHKFEWTRKQFKNWAEDIVNRYPYYSVRFEGICYGPENTGHLGACSQMAIFDLDQESQSMISIKGVEGLFRTIETYIYPFTADDRSDTRKVLDEVLYYINFLTHDDEESLVAVNLCQIQKMMKKCSMSLEALRDILVENGYVIEDRESGPVIILPEENNSEMDEMNEIDEIYISEDTYVDDDLPEDEEQLMEVYDTNTDAVYESLNEESIVIAESQVIFNHENSYLFDGEHSTDHHRLFEVRDADIRAVDDYTINVTDISTMINNREEHTYQGILRNDHDPRASNTTETNNVIEIDDGIITPDITNSSLQAVSQDVDTNINSAQDNADAISSFQPYQSVSRSSTSPGLLFSPELDDSLISQNLLNSTFHRSEVPNEATTIVKLPAESLSIDLSLEGKIEADLFNEIDSEYASLSYSKGNSNVENNIDSVKHQALEGPPNDRMIEMEIRNSFSVYDKPQSTSSPICNKMRTTHTANAVNQIVSTQKNSHLYNGEHSTDLYRSSEKLVVVSDVRFPKCSITEGPITIKQSCLEGDDLISALESYTELIPIETIDAVVSDTDTLKDISHRSSYSDNNIITETINHQATSDNKDNTSKPETDANCSSSNNSQRELYLGSKIVDSDHFTPVDLLQEDGNDKISGKRNLIKHETDIVDIQRVDTHCFLSSDDVHDEYTCHKSKVAMIKPHDDDTGTRLQNGSKVLAHTNIISKSLSPFRELSNAKFWSTSECSSSMCAKENNISDDSFKSLDEDTSNKIVQFASPLRSDENVRCDTKDSTSKDVNTSSFAGLIASAEAKLPSPAFETPPDSWSHEILDSGYPNSASGQDITPENDLSSIAQDHIPDTESPSVAEAPRLGVLEPIEVENGDLANNNRDDEGNNMVAADAANDIEGLQPLIDVLENDLENENDIYALENGFPMWLLRILDMANPLDFDVQPRQNIRVHHEVADADYMDHDEGFDSSSSDE